jgi:cyanate permease
MAIPAASGVDDQGIDSPYRWMMLFGVWLLYYCFGLVISSVAPLVATIVEELQISLTSMGRILGAWQFVYLFCAIPVGIAIDRFGLRASLTLAGLVIAASAALRGLSDSAAAMWLAVAVFGLGGPLISIGAPKVIASWFGSAERGMAMGIYMTGPALGGITALALTNSVLMPWTDYNWRYVMMIFAAVASIAAAIWWLINSSKASRQASPKPTDKPTESTIAVFGRLLRIPLVVVILIMSIGIFTINHGLGNWLPEILRSGGMSATDAGFWAAIPTLAGVVGSLIIPRLATPARRYYLLIGLFAGALIALWLLRTTDGPVLASGLILQGFARSSMMTLAILILMETPQVGAKNIGIAGGLFFTAAEIGGVLGPMSIGLMADLYGGFDAALWMMTTICVILIALAFVVRWLAAGAAHS